MASPAGATVSNKFHQTNLVSDISGQQAQVIDKNLLNPWGLALGPTTPLWVADNNSGKATVYNVNQGGTKVSKSVLTVTIPGGRMSTMDGSSPTGQVFNPTSDFPVTGPGGTWPATFIFSSESGQITAWSFQSDPINMGKSAGHVEFTSKTGAVYKGLAMDTVGNKPFLYATNFHAGRIDVFNSNFKPVNSPGPFKDPGLPAQFAPFGIQNINGLLYVTYAKQKLPDRHDNVAGAGLGFVDVFKPDGTMVKRLASHGTLNAPWGVALAPAGFGPFAGKVLVGDFGDGRINVFDPTSKTFEGQLKDATGKAITIDHLWALHFGTSSTGGTKTLLFSAGIHDEMDGLVGSINPEA